MNEEQTYRTDVDEAVASAREFCEDRAYAGAGDRQVIEELCDLLEGEQAGAKQHTKINRAVSRALGQEEPDDEGVLQSWHDLGEKVAVIVEENKNLRMNLEIGAAEDAPRGSYRHAWDKAWGHDDFKKMEARAVAAEAERDELATIAESVAKLREMIGTVEDETLKPPEWNLDPGGRRTGDDTGHERGEEIPK